MKENGENKDLTMEYVGFDKLIFSLVEAFLYTNGCKIVTSGSLSLLTNDIIYKH